MLARVYDQALHRRSRSHPIRRPCISLEVAVELGDIEGAIRRSNGLLLIDGDEPDVKLELGVLYFRLGSTEAVSQ